jgi:adenylate cyclase
MSSPGASGSRVRVLVQLADGETGGALWAERYDRELGDIFQLQDEIAAEVAAAVEPELLQKEGQKVADRSAQDVTVWDLVRRGMWEFHKFTPQGHLAAREIFRKAIEMAPDAAEGYIWFSRASGGLAAYGWVDDPEETLQEAVAAALRAAQLDKKNPYAHYAVAVSHTFSGLFDAALRAAERAVTLSPSFALGYCFMGATQLMLGRPQQAVEALERGLRLSPFDPQHFTFFMFLALAHYFAGEPEKGLSAAHRALELRPHWVPALKAVALCCHALGNHRQAALALAEVNASTDTKADLLRFVVKFNPVWAQHMEQVFAEIAQHG